MLEPFPVGCERASRWSVDPLPQMLRTPARVCIPNIGPRERQRRLLFGIFALGLTAVLLVLLQVYGAERWLRFALFVPLWGASLGIFQATEKT